MNKVCNDLVNKIITINNNNKIKKKIIIKLK